MNSKPQSNSNGDDDLEVENGNGQTSAPAPAPAPAQPQYDERAMQAFYYAIDPVTVGGAGRASAIGNATLFPAIILLVSLVIRVGLGLRFSEAFWDWSIQGALAFCYLGTVMYSGITGKRYAAISVVLLVWSLMLFL